MVAASQPTAVIHALLHNCPFSRSAYDETMKIKLKAICDGVVVNAGCQSAYASQFIAIQATSLSDGAKFFRRPSRMPSSASAHMDSKFMGPRIQSTFQGAQN